MSYCEQDGCLFPCECSDCSDDAHCHADCAGPPSERCIGCQEIYEAKLDREFDEREALGIL